MSVGEAWICLMTGVLKPILMRRVPAGNDGGYLPTGIGWYRKKFHVDKVMEGKELRLYFEGVYMNSEVFVNGGVLEGIHTVIHPISVTLLLTCISGRRTL